MQKGWDLHPISRSSFTNIYVFRRVLQNSEYTGPSVFAQHREPSRLLKSRVKSVAHCKLAIVQCIAVHCSAVRARSGWEIMMLIATMSPPVKNKASRAELMHVDVLNHDQDLWPYTPNKLDIDVWQRQNCKAFCVCSIFDAHTQLSLWQKVGEDGRRKNRKSEGWAEEPVNLWGRRVHRGSRVMARAFK